ncbi:TetR/AcrR family transcriptional regulator [Saccharicrinis fermentans]|uniref:Regulatory protein n=1 Tax=Saccharicrinis fermentans DSM 9555 = JCM 21142 TaxID=869213 RepID=W7YDI4_9BACT|nr:TetR/AcrR family transcriptional regulator [Saccharicrinis fermentans]GAF05538.1 regulatory protein [Saccharicrinis fermentans DSM 9555 = JCM 21142]
MKIGDDNIEKIVIESTKSLLLKYGVKGWNMDELAKECGMSKRTLYKIIGSKEDLLFRCSTDIIATNYKQLKQFLNQDADYFNILDKLSHHIISEINEFVISSSKIIKTEYPRIADAIDKQVEELHQLHLTFFNKGKHEGLLNDNATPKIIVNIIKALMKHNIENSHNQTDFKEKTIEELNFLFKAIRK